MKPHEAIAMLFLLASVCVAQERLEPRCAENDEPVGAPLTGWVGYTNTGKPVNDMTVVLYRSAGSSAVATTKTDSAGRFSFPTIGAGKYQIVATKKLSGAVITADQVVTVRSGVGGTACLVAEGEVSETSQPAVKVAVISRVNSIAGRLLDMARTRVANGAVSDLSSLNREIDRMLHHEREPDVLARVALISHIYFTPGSAGDERFDDVFDVAWGACIRRIEQIGGQPAIDALEQIKFGMRLDGSYAMLLNDSMERLMSKQSSRPPR